MKPETFWIGSDLAKHRAIARIRELDIDGAVSVTIADTRSKSVRCRGLQWLWATEVAESGIGQYDTKEDVHRAAKWKWAVPILLRDDPDFAEIWPDLSERFRQNPEIMRYIVDNFVSTEGKGFAISEYLTEFERYYRGHGVQLTIPDKGLLEWANEQSA